jgi:signal recognition particle subunit SEC65
MNRTYVLQKVSTGLLSKAAHALGIESAVPRNDKVYPVSTWEEVIEALGKRSNCPAAAIARAKAQYVYYMLYFGSGF